MHRQRIVIVSCDTATLEQVHHYFVRAGALASTQSRLNDLDGSTLADTDVVLFFPDDYPRSAAVAAAEHVRGLSPRLGLIIVTNDPAAYEALGESRPPGLPVVTVTRPAWGWMLMDALRAISPAH
jgi:hypothetical protein